MKKTFLRFVSTALAVFVLFGGLNIGVFAADFADEQNKATDSSEEIKFSVAIESATLATLVANGLTDAEKAVLNHPAVNASLTELFAGNVDSYIGVEFGKQTTTVKAESIETVIGTWTPVSIVVNGYEAVLIDGQTTILDTEFETIEVNYSIAVTEGSEADAVVKLPALLAEEATKQKIALDVYASMINELKAFDVKQFDLEGMKGILQTEAGVAAIDMLLDKCVAEDGRTLLLYTYLAGYVNNGLTYYYTGTHSAEFAEQIAVLRAAFNDLSADPSFKWLIKNSGKEELINKIIDNMNREDLQLLPVNEAIDTNAEDIASLVDAILAVNGASDDVILTVTGVSVIEYEKPEDPEESETTESETTESETTESETTESETTESETTESETTESETTESETTESETTESETTESETTESETTESETTESETTTATQKPTVPVEPEKTIEVQLGNVTFNVSYSNGSYSLLLPAPEESDIYYEYIFDGVIKDLIGQGSVNVPFGGEDIVVGEYDNINDLIGSIVGDSNVDFDEILGDADIDEVLGDLNDENIGVWEEIFNEILDDKNVNKEDKEVDPNADLLGFLKDLNAMLAGSTIEVNGLQVPVMTFIPVEVDGKLSVVLRITPYVNAIDYKDLLGSIIEVFIKVAPYKDIKLDGETLYEAGTGMFSRKFYMQTLVNLFLNCGNDGDNLLKAISTMIGANGNIIDIRDTVAALKNATVVEGFEVVYSEELGGKLLRTDMQVADVQDRYFANYDFYITFEDYGKMAKEMGYLDSAVSTLDDYLTITGENGMLNVSFKVPSKLLAYYLAELFVLDYADITNIDNVDFEGSVNFILSLVKTLLADEDLTLEALENTLEKAGVNYKLSGFMSESNFATVRKLLNSLINNIEFKAEAEGNNMKATTEDTFDITAFVDKLIDRMGDDDPTLEIMLKNVIAEADGKLENGEGITIKVSIEDVTFEKTDIEAIVIDPSVIGINGRDDLNKEDLKDMAGNIMANPKDYLGVLATTGDLAATLKNASANTIIILLDDVTLSSDVVIPNRVFINLNGFTINGNMSTKAAVRITNSNLAKNGGVNGELFGNFVITGGAYTCDVTSMLANGYAVNNGVVESKIYKVVKDENGNVEILLNAGFIAAANNTGVKEFLVDTAFDIAINAFTAASLTVDGNNIYAVELNDILGMLGDKKGAAKDIYDCVNFAGITNFANTLIAEFTNFEALANAVENGEAFASYEITTGSWEITTEVVGDSKKYVTVNVTSKDEKTATLSFKVVGADDEKAALVELLRTFDKIADIDASINLGGFGYANGKVTVDLTGKVTATLDFSEDGRYGALMAAAVAYACPDHRAELVEAIKVAMDGEGYAALTEALGKVSVGDFIDALKKLSTVDFETMMAVIKLDSSSLVALEAVYADLLDIAGKVLARLDISGGYSKLLGYIKTNSDTDATYVFDRENVKGFDVDLTMVLFDEDTVFYTGISIGTSDLLYGSDILTDNNTIILDAIAKGITVDQLKDLLNVVEGVEIFSKDGVEKTGRKLIATTDYIMVNGQRFDVVVAGDINCDGKVDKIDNEAWANSYVEKDDKFALDENSKPENSLFYYAGDLSGDGVINGQDLALMIQKFARAANYESNIKH